MRLILTRQMADAFFELQDAFPCYAVAVTFHYDGTPRFVLTARSCLGTCPWWCLIGADPDEIRQELASVKTVRS